jgi:hypothetical protein
MMWSLASMGTGPGYEDLQIGLRMSVERRKNARPA